MSDRAFGYSLVTFMLAGFAVVIGCAVRDCNAPPSPCSHYAEHRREHVPARCFADFTPDGGR